ncbi:Protein of unknown function [Bacillus mycoides]|nr:Protein of unknown function [Bacillus mycoides]
MLQRLKGAVEGQQEI